VVDPVEHGQAPLLERRSEPLNGFRDGVGALLADEFRTRRRRKQQRGCGGDQGKSRHDGISFNCERDVRYRPTPTDIRSEVAQGYTSCPRFSAFIARHADGFSGNGGFVWNRERPAHASQREVAVSEWLMVATLLCARGGARPRAATFPLHSQAIK
jgi:hypothetical protein